MEVTISTLANFRDEAQTELDDYVTHWRSETDDAKNKLELIKRFSPEDNRESRAFTNSPEVDHMSCDTGPRLTTDS